MKKLLTITGPSCSGKTTLLRNLVEKHYFIEMISTTTRPPREGEINGKDYYFVTDEEFDGIEFVEFVRFSNYRYGTSVAELNRCIDTGKIPIVIAEPNGTKQFIESAEKYGYTIYMVYLSADLPMLFERFLKRFRNDNLGDVRGYADRLCYLVNDELYWDCELNYDLPLFEYGPGVEEDYEQSVIDLVFNS